MVINYLDKKLTIRSQKMFAKTARNAFLFYNFFMIMIFLIAGLGFMSISYFIVNFVYIIWFSIFYFNVKHHEKFYNKKIKELEEGKINIIKCRYSFTGILKHYKSGSYYKIEKYNGSDETIKNGGYYFLNDENFNIGNGLNILSPGADMLPIYDYFNKFDFETLKEKRKLKLKKIKRSGKLL